MRRSKCLDTDTFPSSQRRGGRDSNKDVAKPPLKGADGVVSSAKRFGRSDHPVCACSVASRDFLIGAATPPLRGGEYVLLLLVFLCLTSCRQYMANQPRYKPYQE